MNPYHCSVFISELIAISGALDHVLNSYNDSICTTQYLKSWRKIMDSTSLDILSKLVRLGQRKQVCIQWIPSHVSVPGNEAADELAGSECDLPNPSSTVLTHTEIHSFQRNKMNMTWRNPPSHHWYAAKSPGLSIQCMSSRAHQTALAHFRRGHLHSMTFCAGGKVSLPVPAFSLLLLPIFWTAGAFPCDSCMKSKAWCERLLRGKGRLRQGSTVPGPKASSLGRYMFRSRLCPNNIMIWIIVMIKYYSRTYSPQKRDFQAACQLIKVINREFVWQILTITTIDDQKQTNLEAAQGFVETVDQKGVMQIEHPPTSPGFNPPDFFLFP
ncbi:RNase H domain-containing protein [Trichonephila clavipes]|nr:RNase H domain-containing protein [Trichonephila clavipes]